MMIDVTRPISITWCKVELIRKKNLEWDWALAQRGSGQNIKGSCVTKSSPCHHIDERESSWIIGVCEKGHFLGKAVTSLQVGHSILLWHSGLGQRVSVEWQEHKASQGKRGHGGSSNHEVHIRDGLGGDLAGSHWLVAAHSSDTSSVGWDHRGHSSDWGSGNHCCCLGIIHCNERITIRETIIDTLGHHQSWHTTYLGWNYMNLLWRWTCLRNLGMMTEICTGKRLDRDSMRISLGQTHCPMGYHVLHDDSPHGLGIAVRKEEWILTIQEFCIVGQVSKVFFELSIC